MPKPYSNYNLVDVVGKLVILQNMMINCKLFEQAITGRPNTKKTQISLFRNWIEPHSNAIDFAHVEGDLRGQVNKLLNDWENHALKPGTIRA